MIKDVDTTRYVTMGADKFRFGDGSGDHEKIANELDAVGFNYSEDNYKKLRAKHPNWLIYGSETSSATQMCIRDRLAIIAGGTGLYIQSLLEGYHLGGETPHEEILAYRASLEPYSDEELAHLVEQAGLEIPQFNRRRAMRALEIAHFGQDLENQETLYEPLIICLDDERSQLYERINNRVDLMFEAGLLDEAKWLFDHYPDAQAAKGIGYKELFPYFRGEQTLEEASESLKQATRRFAKRQLTWFRNRRCV